MRIAPSSVLPHGLYSCDIFVVQDRCHLFRCSEIFRHKAGKTHSHGCVATIDRPYSVSIRYVYIYPIYFGTLEQFGLEPLWLLGFSLFQSCSNPYQNLDLVPKLGLHDPVGPRTCPGDCFCFCNNVSSLWPGRPFSAFCSEIRNKDRNSLLCQMEHGPQKTEARFYDVG